MTIVIEDINKLADLAKLDLTDSEKESYLKDINGILSHLEEIKNAELDEVETKQPFFNYTRDDVLRLDTDNRVSKDQIYKNMPNKSSDNQVKVSKVLKK